MKIFLSDCAPHARPNSDASSPSGDTVRACTAAYAKALTPGEWYRYVADRALPAAVLLFLLAVLNASYRYLSRLASFYNSRAGALSLLEEASAGRQMNLEGIGSPLKPDNLDFEATKAPIEQIVEIASNLAKQT